MRFFVLAFMFILAGPALAKDVRPYQSLGRFAMPNNEGAFPIKQGDTVQFSNGRSFFVRRVFEGGTNLILDVGDGRVVRIPKSPRLGSEFPLSSYISGYRALAENGVKVPEILFSESEPREYIVQRLIDVRALLTEVEALSPSERERAMNKLVDFASSTAAFNHIGDFAARQLAWTGFQWVLLDWTDEHTKAGTGILSLAPGHVFRALSQNIPEPYFSRISDVIMARRQAMLSSSTQSSCANALGMDFNSPF